MHGLFSDKVAVSSTNPDWDMLPGRCGSCARFEKDFGSEERAYGHCGRKPRSGSITSTAFKCDAYAPMPGFAVKAKKPVKESRLNPFDIRGGERSRKRKKTTSTRGTHKTETVWRSTRHDRDQEPVNIEGLADMDKGELRNLIQEAIEDSLGIGEVEPVDRYKGGTLVVKPASDELSPKEIPIDQLFRKVVMIRDNLRVLEQKINGHSKLDDADRVALQHYITRCYGSLTTFNALFKNRADWFKGAGK
ncbi:MAG: hypothetical protein VX223_05810 [Myxococcota bacterium]|nr:hypothetical protein [Myxococcota bacterium]